MLKQASVVNVTQTQQPPDQYGNVSYNIVLATDAGNVSGLIRTQKAPQQGESGWWNVEQKTAQSGKQWTKVTRGKAPEGQYSQSSPAPKKDVDWDAIAEGKCKSLFVQAGIQSGQIVLGNDEATIKQNVDIWTNYVMGKEAPRTQFEQDYDISADDSDDFPFP